MAVMKEYICLGHGIFESTRPFCPSGCNTVNRIFLTAPGIKGERTGNIDRTLDMVAQDMGLSDMSNRHGRTVAENRKRDMPVADMSRLQAGFAPIQNTIGQTMAANHLETGTALPTDLFRPPRPSRDSLIHKDDLKK